MRIPYKLSYQSVNSSTDNHQNVAIRLPVHDIMNDTTYTMYIWWPLTVEDVLTGQP